MLHYSGFGTGIAQSAVFVSLQAVIASPAHLAPAISFMYLSTTIAVTLGLALSNAVLQTFLRRSLWGRLVALGLGGDEIQPVSLMFYSSLYMSTYLFPSANGL
jgi:hypothetical protein